MLKKAYLSILIFLLAILSTTVSVFAWIIAESSVQVEGEEIHVVDDYIELDINLDIEFVFDYINFESLMYVQNSDFSIDATTDYEGYATIIDINLKFDYELETDVQIFFNSTVKKPIADECIGNDESFLFMVHTTRVNFEIDNIKDSIDETDEGQFHREVLNKIRNKNSVIIEAGTTEQTLQIAIWGYYDGLTEELQENYYSLAYPVTFTIKGVAINEN